MLKVAFVCVHNSCRSQIAEALGRHLAADVFEWAKRPNKPTYSYEEITNLPDIPAGTVLKVTTPENSGLQITDEAVNPSIEFDSNAVFILDGGSAPAVEEGNS